MPADEAALWQRWRAQGDRDARRALVERHLPYARTVAATYYKRRTHDEIDFAEVLQLASVALVESVDRYRTDGGAQFRTFAARRMHGAIVDGLERLTERLQQAAAQRRLRAERLQAAKAQASEGSAPDARAPGDVLMHLAEVALGLALGILLEGTGMVDAEPLASGATEAEPHYRHVELALLRRRLAHLLERLPLTQRRVLQLHYLHEHSFVDIARDLALSTSRISQLHRQAIDALRRALGGKTRDIVC
jgi:RNA polymerase sigma factor for flagellar operon FliA